MNTLTLRVKCGVTWLMILMFEMFISQGHSRWHLLKKPGCGLPDSGWLAKGSRCCASLLWCTSSGWHLQSLWGVHCRWGFPWGICYRSCRSSYCWVGCCQSNWCSSWGWSHWEQTRWRLECSRCCISDAWQHLGDAHGYDPRHICIVLHLWPV